MSEVKPFNREARYVVLKISDLNKLRGGQTQVLREEIARISRRLPKRECLVIESDWPEYGPAWKMIQQRMTGEGFPAAETRGYSVIGNPYAIRLTRQEILDLSEDYEPHIFELVARCDFDAQRLRADTAEARVKTAEHDLEFFKAGKNEQFDRAEAAEQRIAELLDLLRDINDAPGGSQFRKSIEAALNPNPEAESNE